MFHLEDQVKVEQSAGDSEMPNPSETSTMAAASVDITTPKNESLPGEQKLPSNKNNPLLNDHDYCSPNKHLRQINLKDKMKQESGALSDNLITAHDNQSSQATTLTASECPASTSSSPTNLKFASQISNKNSNGQTNVGELNKYVDDDNLSQSSSSSSSLSDDDSDGLVIADPRPKSLAPKDTPSVSKPKPGRPGRPPSKPGNPMDQAGRTRRPRQNTSVTDKSQWITGEDQVDTALSEHLGSNRREKRARKAVVDPDFSNYTSEDYSSSDAESDDSDEDDDENDPNKPWCVCLQPHGGDFMICCDICSYWYHGRCVGVDEKTSKRWEKENKEWLCGECQTYIHNGTPREEIPTKITKKEKKTKNSKSGRRGRGRPKKSEVATRESVRLSSRLAARKPNSSLDSKLGTRKNPNKYDAARRESFELFGDEQRLKGLIRERKQAFLFKRQLAEKERLAKMKELGITGQSLTGTLGNSLDSLATSTNSPNMSNLPLNIKSEPKEKAKHNIVLQINKKKDGEVTAVVKSKKRKQSESSDQVIDDLFTADPIQVSKKPKSDVVKQQNHDIPGSSSGDRRGSDGSKSGEKQSLSEPTERQAQTTPKKKRKDNESSTTTPFGSKDIAKKIKECLETRVKQLKDFAGPSSDVIEKLADEIEVHLNECFKEGSQKYLNKYRSLIFNFTKNQELVKNVLIGEISPERLVRMSPEEMAPHELAKWRERHSKHEIELIKHNAQMIAKQVIVKKTHKGEEVISAPLLNDPDDLTAEVNNQEPPTTPTKATTKETKEEKISPSTSSFNSGTPSVDAEPKTPEAKKVPQQLSPEKEPSNSGPMIETAQPLGTVNDNQNQNSDTNQQICREKTAKVAEDNNTHSEEGRTVTAEADSTVPTQTTQPTVQQTEPKRFRVSIETSLDPSNMSRFRDQPLIKPIERSQDTGEYSPSKVTPNADSNDEEAVEEEEEELYDPETMLPASSTSNDQKLPKLSSPSTKETPWSGNITMADVGKFAATVSPVSGDSSFMRDEISQNLLVCGRIRPEQVSTYVKQIKATTKNPIISIQFHPKSPDDKAVYDSLFDYLYTRNRYGVIDNRAHTQVFRDFYIIPIHEGGSIPEVSKPVQGPGLSKNHRNCLLGLIVKTKRPGSAQSSASTSMPSSTAGYTPTSIN